MCTNPSKTVEVLFSTIVLAKTNRTSGDLYIDLSNFICSSINVFPSSSCIVYYAGSMVGLLRNAAVVRFLILIYIRVDFMAHISQTGFLWVL